VGAWRVRRHEQLAEILEAIRESRIRSIAATRLLAWTGVASLVSSATHSHRVEVAGFQDSKVTGSFCRTRRCTWIACGLGITQPGAGAEAEDGGEVKRVGAAGEGFFDDPVVAELFGGDGQAPATTRRSVRCGLS
jgi:hypothetical protein